MAEAQIYKAISMTDEELEFVTNLSIVSSSIGAISFLVFFSCLIYIAIKTRLPGRIITLISATLWFVFYGYTYYMGGSLEMVFGPIGMIYDVIAYTTIFSVFTLGFLRMSLYFKNNH